MGNWIKVHFVAMLVMALAIAAVAPSWGDPPAAPSAATYDLKIAGYVKGKGTGEYSGSTLSLSATVEDENGNKGDFTATSLTIDAKSHFEGTGTVFGKTMKISGRLDDPKPGDTQLKARRVVGTFKTSDSHYGRIAGFVSGSVKPKDD